MFFIYFLPIDSYKNLDEHYKILPNSSSNLIQREIKYKIVYYSSSNSNLFSFSLKNFSPSIYHIFYSSSILNKNNISFIVNSQSFVSITDNDNDNDDNLPCLLPCLTDFSSSFFFPTLQFNNLKLYFPLSLCKNSYIPFDVFLITYFLHNPIDNFCQTNIDTILDLFCEGREKIEKIEKIGKIEINKYKNMMAYFYDYNSVQIIKYLLQFKSTWTYYSICSFFLFHYSDLLKHFSLHHLFHTYIHSSFKERNTHLIQDIHDILFIVDKDVDVDVDVDVNNVEEVKK